MKRPNFLPKGYCEIGFDREIALIEEAKKLKQAASVQKKREQVNSTRASMQKKQGDLAKAMSVKI